MTRYSGGLLALLFLAAACTDAPTPRAAPADEPLLTTWGIDADHDGIDDGTEWALANQYAPVLYMPNMITRAEAGAGVQGDWTWPANVDWYLPQVRMRIHHNNCTDHQLLNFGQVTPTNLLQQAHQRFKLGVFGCSHSTPVQYSDTSWHVDDHYFLQAGDDAAVHPGMRTPSQWKSYVHSYPNDIGGITLQYWVFYAYNDGISSQNHEGDWEHVAVKLNASHTPAAVIFSAHGHLNAYAPSQVTWYGGTHPEVWVADGSHASFRSQSVCNTTLTEGVYSSCWTNHDQRWFTWAGGRGTAAGIQGAGLVALGEKAYPTSGQQWIRYSGRWGEKGQFDGTSGPRGPAYQSSWNHQRM